MNPAEIATLAAEQAARDAEQSTRPPPFVLYHTPDGCILNGPWAGWDVTEVAQTVIRQWREAEHFCIARYEVRRPWWRLWRPTDVLIVEVLPESNT